METNLKLERSTLVPENDLGGKARIILSVLLTFSNISVIAATKQFSLKT